MAQKPVLETAVMLILWREDEWLTPATVRERLGRRVAYTTAMTVLVRLWRKGRVERRKQGRAYEYRAAQSRAAYTAERMEEALGATDDRAQALSHFLETLPVEERRELRRLLGGT